MLLLHHSPGGATAPATMSTIIYQCFKLSFATLYPAYASYKAVKTKNVKDYVSLIGGLLRFNASCMLLFMLHGLFYATL